MSEPLTEKLLEELLSSPDAQSYLSSHDSLDRSLSDYLQDLLDAHGQKRSEAIRASELNETYGYQLFAGQRKKPSRDKLLQLAFGMKLTLLEADRLMKIAGVSPLYCKNRRDAIMIFCLEKGYSLQKANEELFRFNEETIS